MSAQERPEQSLKSPRVARRASGVAKSRVAAESLIDTKIENSSSMLCVVWVGVEGNPVRKGCLSARILFGYCRRKSANPGSPGKETTTHYHHASWQGGFFSLAQYPFFTRWPQRRGRPFGHIATQKRGKSLTWRWSTGSSLAPRALAEPAEACRGREQNVRSGVLALGPARNLENPAQALRGLHNTLSRRSTTEWVCWVRTSRRVCCLM